jgi:hypothetical protein
MVIAFDGGAARAAIKTKMDAALALYGLEISEVNYSRAGSALVALQEADKAKGCATCSAIAILDEMLAAGHPAGSMTFAEGAALASTGLLIGQ